MTSGLKPYEREVLGAAIELQPHAYTNNILDLWNRDIPDNWLTQRYPMLRLFKEHSMGKLHSALHRLEDRGYLTSEWSAETFPDRGDRRRRYYYPTALALALFDFQENPYP